MITCDSCDTSIPLAATSVATSACIDPSLSALRAFCLWFCDLLPCRAAALTHILLRCFSILLAQCLVRVNTTALVIFVLLNMSVRSAFLSCLVSVYRVWSMVSTVEEAGVTVICTGSVKNCPARSITLSVVVAEKNSVWRFLGIWLLIFLISWINHISIIRSASSRMSTSTLVRLMCFWSMRSRSLPGVATNISTPLRSALTWLPCLTPPYITVFLRLVLREYLRRFSPIWIASSLVGVTIRLRIHTRSLRHWLSSCVLSSSCSIGRLNDAVLPVPVCAHPKISCPCNATGIDCSCIGVGVWYHSASSTSRNLGASQRSLKVVIVVGW